MDRKGFLEVIKMANINKTNIVIVGGGISGLTAAEKLAENNYKVIVLEKDSVVGGLARSFLLENKWIPVTYHHVMTPDETTQAFIKKLGLWNNMVWKRSSQSFWYDGEQYLLSKAIHIARFEPLDFLSKLKLFKFGIYCWFKKDWNDLEDVECDKWLNSIIGERATQILFKNLMDIKFNMPLSSVSMAWLGRRLHQSVRNRETYGYIRSGVQGMLEKLCANINQKGGVIKTNFEVTKIGDGFVEGKGADGKHERFEADKVISSVAPPILMSICNLSEPSRYILKRVKYKSIVSFVCGSYDLLTKVYWSVILKPSLSFGGIFNHTVLCPDGGVNGENVYYLFTYLNDDDPLFNMESDEIRQVYLRDLQKVYPGFKTVWDKIFKIRFSQPVFLRDYKNPPIQLEDNLFLTGVYKEYPNPRTMDSAFKSGLKTAEYILGMQGK